MGLGPVALVLCCQWGKRGTCTLWYATFFIPLSVSSHLVSSNGPAVWGAAHATDVISKGSPSGRLEEGGRGRRRRRRSRAGILRAVKLACSLCVSCSDLSLVRSVCRSPDSPFAHPVARYYEAMSAPFYGALADCRDHLLCTMYLGGGCCKPLSQWSVVIYREYLIGNPWVGTYAPSIRCLPSDHTKWPIPSCASRFQGRSWMIMQDCSSSNAQTRLGL